MTLTPSLSTTSTGARAAARRSWFLPLASRWRTTAASNFWLSTPWPTGGWANASGLSARDAPGTVREGGKRARLGAA
jgi:hypothetical protein